MVLDLDLDKIKVVVKKKECELDQHIFEVIPNSAWIPLADGTGLGFKTWECQNCGKKVKSS